MSYTLVLLRHGQSQWNLDNRFTGWTDVDLTPAGEEEARAGAEELRKNGFAFDLCYTSVLKRAVKTLNIVLDVLDQDWLPVHKSWRLNERHYGALQGLNKAETTEKYGEDQVFAWRRSFDVPPPELTADDPRLPSHDRRYDGVPKDELPLAESLKLTIDRVLPYWEQEIVPSITSGKRVLITAHGNSLRALVKHLDSMDDETITGLNIPTGAPLVYELDAKLQPVKSYYLGDAQEIAARAKAVAEQAGASGL